MLRSFQLVVAVAQGLVAVAQGVWPMTTLRGLWPVVLVETQATRPKTHRLDRFLLYNTGLLAVPPGEW